MWAKEVFVLLCLFCFPHIADTWRWHSHRVLLTKVNCAWGKVPTQVHYAWGKFRSTWIALGRRVSTCVVGAWGKVPIQVDRAWGKSRPRWILSDNQQDMWRCRRNRMRIISFQDRLADCVCCCSHGFAITIRLWSASTDCILTQRSASASIDFSNRACNDTPNTH